MSRRTFQLPATDEGDPPVFELVYKTKGRRGQYEEQVAEFQCLPYLPAAALRYPQDSTNTAASIVFIERCIAADEDAERFMRLINNRNVMVRGEELGDVLEWLAAEYGERPFGGSEPSPTGQPPTGDTSADDSDSPAQT